MPSPETSTLSVIIPAVNEAEGIEACVRSAASCGAMEVIVVDAGSTDGTCELALKAGATVINCPPGRAAQMNHGFANSRGAVVLFLHADSRVESVAGNAILSAIAQGASWGCFHQRIEAAGLSFRCIERGNRWRAKWLHKVFGDQGMWVSRSQFESAGRFPDVPLMEDLMLSRQLSRKLGAPTVLECRLTTSPRRWLKRGIWQQTIRNWILQIRFALGVSPQRLADSYRRHDRS